MDVNMLQLAVLAVVCLQVSALSSRSHYGQFISVFPQEAKSERDLQICPEGGACNIIHKKFWLPPLVERLCRCADRHDCPWTWSTDLDDYTMELNNRAQMKFCQDLSEMAKCSPKKVALTTKAVKQLDNEVIDSRDYYNTRKVNKQYGNHKHHRNDTITAHCHCQQPHHWRVRVNTTMEDNNNNNNNNNDVHSNSYYCAKLKKCQELDFCGYVRTDFLSVYYRCSCPQHHMCMTHEKTVHHISEVAYQGPAYKAYCLPTNTGSKRRKRRRHQTPY